jgi:hypothetical protein
MLGEKIIITTPHYYYRIIIGMFIILFFNNNIIFIIYFNCTYFETKAGLTSVIVTMSATTKVNHIHFYWTV